MNPHRQHTLDVAPTEPIDEAFDDYRLNARQTLALLVGLIVVCVLVSLGLAIFINAPLATQVKPVPTPAIVTTPLPPPVSTHDAMLGRLRDWRAGYEEAVSSGCKPQPRLTGPLGLHP